MSKKIRERWSIIVNWLQQNALAILGALCFLYAQFGSRFAELHIKLWFLDFPIFIGEILLAFYIILFIKKCRRGVIQFRRWHILLLLYVTFILCKAFYGYWKWGALAFRNAALFYNTFFIAIAYYLFKEGLEKSKFMHIATLSILIVAPYLYPPYSYFTYTYLLLGIVVLHLIQRRKLRYILIALFLISFPYRILFSTCRADIVSITFALLLLMGCLFLVLKIRIVYKITICLATLVILALFLHIYVEKSDLRSLLLPRYVVKQYNYYAKLIDTRKDKFGQMRDMQVLVYDNNKTGLYASPEERREMAAKAAREAERIAKREAKQAAKKAEALTLKARKQQKEAEAAVVLIQQKEAEATFSALRQEGEAEEAVKEEAKPIELARAVEAKESAETETVAKQQEPAEEVAKPIEIAKVETAEQEAQPIEIAKAEDTAALVLEAQGEAEEAVKEEAKPIELAKAVEAKESAETETVAKTEPKTEPEISKIEAAKQQEPAEEVAKPIEITKIETAEQEIKPIVIAKLEQAKQPFEAEAITQTESEIIELSAPKQQESLEEIARPIKIAQEAAEKIEAARHKAEAIRLAALKTQKAAEEVRNKAETAMRKAEEIASKEAEEQTMWIQEAELRKAAEVRLGAKNSADQKARQSQKDYVDANITWRIFAWKDMCAELVENIFKSRWGIFGIDFGKPFRSKSIEVLEWSMGGWVGWIEPHNSYLHILYRAGIIGFLFIIIVWSLFVGMLVLFIKIRDIKGILLCSALSYWFSVSNFAVILELPYFAIPFWSLFGATLAYYHKAKRVRE